MIQKGKLRQNNDDLGSRQSNECSIFYYEIINTVNKLIDFALFTRLSFFLSSLQPQTVCSIESLSRLVIAREDDITHTVNIYMEPDRLISFMMEDRDALEFRLVLAGYYKLMTGKSQ